MLSVAATVLRTNFFGLSAHASRRSISDWIFSASKEARPIEVFGDVLFSPLSMSTLCAIIEKVARLRPPGIFNLGSLGGMSKADFAFAFAATLALPNHFMTRSTVDQAGVLKAWRPKDMRMDSSKIEHALGQPMPRLEDEIKLVAKDYRADV